MKPTDAPCYGCPDRAVGCHGNCEAYKAYRSEREATYQYRRAVLTGSPDIPSKKKQQYMNDQTRIQRKGYLK